MISNGSSWTIAVPSEIVAENYVLKYETVALPQVQSVGGVQSFLNVRVCEFWEAGMQHQIGPAGTALYDTKDPGINDVDGVCGF